MAALRRLADPVVVVHNPVLPAQHEILLREPLHFEDVTGRYGERPREHRPAPHERVQLAVLPARVDVRGKRAATPVSASCVSPYSHRVREEQVAERDGLHIGGRESSVTP
jgi:hypothetical protein